ncbi:AzlD domain-containing protein [Deferribacter autotrophicus]|uniref:AzlD domain-containing protein n=1 Tax=Deferribacter autotrophicus TaxID=500465 RepID=A0A5A8F904_9BACT|nr:AzlD domain-containing protein [Deferribacter autotrophicus]KAA0259521.1 AzlD domain-containing protein [Deferribacter autotrophicus]
MPYSNIEIWITFFICGVLTFLIRFSFIQFANEKLINRLKEVFSFMPASILSALVFAGVFEKGIKSIEVSNIKIYASLFALFIAVRYKNTILTILSGLLVVWIYTIFKTFV